MQELNNFYNSNIKYAFELRVIQKCFTENFSNDYNFCVLNYNDLE
jgi:hypothetical protein